MHWMVSFPNKELDSKLEDAKDFTEEGTIK